MKGNNEECHLIMSTIGHLNIQQKGLYTVRMNCEKLLGVGIDHKLIFGEQL